MSTAFKHQLAQCGIAQQLLCPSTLEQNGLVERKHRHIMETTLTKLFHANVPLKFWVDAFLTTVYLINRLPSSSLNMKTPFFKIYGKIPNYLTLKIFCLVFHISKGKWIINL